MPWEILQQSTEVVAIHAALLTTSPEGDVLLFGDWKDVTTDAAGPTHCRTYHMATRTVEGFADADRPSTNAFCAGQAFMSGGSLLVAGGTVRRPTWPNLALDGDMEAPATSSYTPTNCALSKGTTERSQGTRSLKVVTTAAFGAASQGGALPAGTATISVSVRHKQTAGTNGALVLRLTPSGTLIGTDQGTSGSWTLRTVSGAIQPGDSGWQVSLRGGDSGADVSYFDDLKVEAYRDLHDAMGHWDGERACWIYRPRDKRWFRTADLNFQPGSTSQGGGRWYPMLVTLADGQVFAAGGHPSDTDYYWSPGGGGGVRHNNNTPERFGPGPDRWTLITSAVTAPDSVQTDEYPRLRLLPNGLLFTSTEGMGSKRMFDALAGQWTGPDVNTNALPGEYSRGSARTAVLLPLLPPNYVARILATNSAHPTSFIIEINAAPAWAAAPARQGLAAGKARRDACLVLLPTAQVLLTGGTQPGAPATPVLEPELYTPAVDWATGAFTGDGQWETINEPASLARPYHSVALLLPDGRVWTAGGTQGWDPGLPAAEKRVELFSPWYVGKMRPRIIAVSPLRRRPRREGFAYGETFRVEVNGDIGRVALLRCGSVTHSYDPDQRYIGLVFAQQGGTLTVTAPPNGGVAPPGYYMLWVLDVNGVPCERAAFVHLPALLRPLKRKVISKRPKKKPKYPPPKKRSARPKKLK